MPLPSSGPLSLNDIQTEFGGTNPIGMNEYYAGGGLVPAGTTGTFGAVPSSGALSVQNFYGTSQTPPAYIEESFSTFLYTGNGTTQPIVNGINLSADGGLVWTKMRSNIGNNYRQHFLFDTNRGGNAAISSNSIDAAPTQVAGSIGSFNTNGFTLASAGGGMNLSNFNYVSWTFKQQPKFFDVVTYAGNGVAGRQIAHSLGSAPGCIIVKNTNVARDWAVWHRSLADGTYLKLNTTDAAITNTSFQVFGDASGQTSSVFTVGKTGSGVNGLTNANASGETYVAYLFAHNAGGFGPTGTDNVVSCSSYAGNGGTQTITLGYEPQWIMIKCSSDFREDGWIMVDNMRGMSNTGNRWLLANFQNAETDESPRVIPTATGFTLSANASVNGSGSTYIYIAIRRGPMKVPTTGTSVFNVISRNGTGVDTAVAGGAFPSDSFWVKRSDDTAGWVQATRLLGLITLSSSSTSDEQPAVPNQFISFDQSGYTAGTGGATNNPNGIYSNYFFGRAPGYFDVVCYAGNSTARTLTHNLAVVPELIIIKSRTDAFNWIVYSQPVGNTAALNLNSDITPVTSVWWNNTTPTSSVFTLGGTSANNAVGATFVAYLFASCPGVSKVGSFTGTGATQVVNCGFTAGSRFVLIKATSTTGDWLVWDSVRGIVAGNDPYLRLNTGSPQTTGTDWVDTAATGFELSNAGGNLANSSGVSYIFLAIA